MINGEESDKNMAKGSKEKIENYYRITSLPFFGLSLAVATTK